jgi:5-methyltetrahydrofolate--homocysteine methyltransferase
MGSEIGDATAELFRKDRYREYLLLHGLAVELTEVYAGIIHGRMEEKLGIDGGMHGAGPRLHRGTRFSAGYSCCPDLSINRTLAGLLKAEDLGVEFTTDDQMVPEFTTSAFVSFHPEAHYFSL